MALSHNLTYRLKNPELFEAIADPAWLGLAADNPTFAVFNPATGELLADIPDMGAAETRAAIDRAGEAQTEWAALTARERSDTLWRWHQLIVRHTDDLATILTAEMGKPLAEAKSEVSHAAAYLQWYAEEANRVYGETIPAPSRDRRMIVIKQPIGVVGAITPWNYPAELVGWKLNDQAVEFHKGKPQVDSANPGDSAFFRELYGTLAAKGDHTPDRPHRLPRSAAGRAPERPAHRRERPECRRTHRRQWPAAHPARRYGEPENRADEPRSAGRCARAADPAHPEREGLKP